MPFPTKTMIETQLPADHTLETDHFEIAPNGNVIVKNKELSEMLAKNIKLGTTNPDINAVRVGIVVDF